jgi:tRNA threonylcarbamoyladenosine biosynthesis protein TsaB
MMSIWLAFDAGSPVTSAAVARAGALLGESSGESRSGPSLLHQIDSSLRRAAIAIPDLDGILVLSGPGSFTGIRVALATALGFRAGLAVRVVALSNLAALALQTLPGRPPEAAASPGGAPLLALVDALRDEWFVQGFERTAHGLAATTEPERFPVEAIALPADVVLAAHAAQPLPVGLAGNPVHRAVALSPAVAVAASAGWLDGLVSEEIEPLYLRAFTPRSPRP